jgi:hypothetical protein
VDRRAVMEAARPRYCGGVGRREAVE